MPEGPRYRLVVLAPNWLGDAVMTLPLIADLRRAWPGTSLSVAARPSVAPLFDLVEGIEQVLTLQPHARRTLLRNWRADAERLAHHGFDAALLLPNSFAAAWLVSRARIRERWGVAGDLRGRLLTQSIPRPPRHLHQAEYYQAIGVALGIEPGARFARLTIRDSHLAHARELLESRGFDGTRPFVVLAPGAAYGRAKQWLPERFAQLAAQLAHDGIASVLVGARGDADACDVVARHVAAINLAGATDLPTLAAVLSLSRAVVSNDSGAMHLAGAAGARVIGIFGPTDERRTSPLRSDASAQLPVIVATDVWCRPCMLRECPIDHRCMSEISAERVRTAVEAP